MSPSSPIMLEKTVGQISKTTEYQPTFIYFKPFFRVQLYIMLPILTIFLEYVIRNIVLKLTKALQ